jgi:hypothetical protein
MLTVNELSRITLELKLGLPPSLTSQEAMAMREATAIALAQMQRDHVAPEIVFDFFDDDLPPLLYPPSAPPTDAQIQADKLNAIRHSLASGMALADAFEREDRQVGVEARALEARLTSLAPLTAATREQLLAEIQTNYGEHWPSQARWLKKLVRDST